MFVILKSLGGQNYLDPERVIAVTSTEPAKCVVVMEGGVMIPVSEPAKDVVARIQDALVGPDEADEASEGED
jgi:hypothetical protein